MPRRSFQIRALLRSCAWVVYMGTVGLSTVGLGTVVGPSYAADLVLTPSPLTAPMLKLMAVSDRLHDASRSPHLSDLNGSRAGSRALGFGCPPGYACVACLANCQSDQPGIIQRRRLPAAARELFTMAPVGISQAGLAAGGMPHADDGLRSAGNWSSLQCYPEGGCTSSGAIPPPRRHHDIHITVHRTYSHR
jgi:hypothetical protein